ncbi:MAG: aminopeptidase N [Burkholderiaceae bacterium]|nr:aminopeptidase N [Burkholderiaceae bacterium]
MQALMADASQMTSVIKREDYAAPAFWIETVTLSFDLDPTKTRVLNKMRLRRNPDVAVQPLRLQGEDLTLTRVMVNGQGSSFKIDNGDLVLESLPEGLEPFDLELLTMCNPEKNTQLMGLYMSNQTFFTQCEAQGFRRITYFLDRPDVMATYEVILRANKATFPVLLANGNLVESGDLPDGRHFARWQDPHPKPSYLFALVAGDLVCREQRITARNGQSHLLQIYVRPGDLDKTEHAMNALMASIAWDESRFNLPLDLERFMIVATSDFNMGAMENKGLNVFNTKFVLASPATATDTDFANVESVVAHEYFHNWTGNRVTCRDWFQLSLKEGLTVFRDQEFSQDMAGSASGRAVKRIDDVRVLRTAQFPEDAGPMAHPVRPDQYEEINNFYTVTIYEKGAEVVRMMQTLVGRDGFAKGMALYFERFDGQAVTCDDFIQAIADANPNSDLTQHLTAFKRWYSQAGTPRVHAVATYAEGSQTFTLELRQSCAPTPGQPVKDPFVIPVSVGLVGQDGSAIPLTLSNDDPDAPVMTTRTLVLNEPSERFVFTNVTQPVVPSLLRGFSAPVVLDIDLSDLQWLHLLAHDSDPFNQWEASQRLALGRLLGAIRQGGEVALDEAYLNALRAVLRHPTLAPGFKELVLTLPSESYIAEQLHSVDPQRIHSVREQMRAAIAQALATEWAEAFAAYNATQSYRPDAQSSGQRGLANLALNYLVLNGVKTGDAQWSEQALQRFNLANNMTDRFGAMAALVNSGSHLAGVALDRFYAMFKHDALVLDKWFALQCGRVDRGGDVLASVKRLLAHPDFSIKNPNRARSVLSTYCQGNPAAFHRADAGGYVLWAEKVIELDAFNPQVAARLARALDRWEILAEPYKAAARIAIERVAAKPDLSADVREVVSRALA